MIDTAGFYKYDGELLYAPNTVWLPDGQVLQRSDPPSEPVSGWQWFNTEADAYEAYGLQPPETTIGARV